MPLASKTFRIFVSSTFSDLKEEQNTLQKHVFSRLRELCREHLCLFQAIDLRWGVSQEAAIPTDYKELFEEFQKRLALAKAESPLIVFIDAFNHLFDGHNTKNLTLLPSGFPGNVAYRLRRTSL